MKYMNATLNKVYLVFILLLPTCFISANAVQVMQIEGEVLSLGRDTINVNDMQFKIISTIKVYSVEKQISSLSSVRVGSFVRIEIQKYNGKFYVDSIFLLPRLSLNE